MNHDNKKLTKAIEKAKGGIDNDQKLTLWIIGTFALMFVLAGIPIVTSAIPSELAKGNEWSWMLLFIPFMGLAFVPFLWKLWRGNRLTGPMKLHLDPLPGQLQGDVGGRFVMNTSHAGEPFLVKLQFMRVDSSGDSGDDILWQGDTKAHHRSRMDGEEVVFVFDMSKVPEGAVGRGGFRATGESGRTDGKQEPYYWVLYLKGLIQRNGQPVEIERRWKIPVAHGTQRSSVAIPSYVREKHEQVAQQEAQAQLAIDTDIIKTSTGMTLVSPPGRNKTMWYSFAGVGLVLMLVSAGLWLWAEKEFSVWMIIGGFGLFGLFMGGLGMWGRFKSSEVQIHLPQVHVKRYWMGRTIGEKTLMLHTPDQLEIKQSGSMQSSGSTTFFYDLQIINPRAPVNTFGRDTSIASGIKGQRAAELLHQEVVSHLFGDLQGT